MPLNNCSDNSNVNNNNKYYYCYYKTQLATAKCTRALSSFKTNSLQIYGRTIHLLVFTKSHSIFHFTIHGRQICHYCVLNMCNAWPWWWTEAVTVGSHYFAKVWTQFDIKHFTWIVRMHGSVLYAHGEITNAFIFSE